MLVLSRRIEEKIVLPGLGVTVQVLSIKGNVVRLGIDAPQDVKIFREELLAQDTRGDEQKLEIEPVVAKPEKQVGAENDGHRAETQNPLFAARPADQHVERIHERKLSEN